MSQPQTGVQPPRTVFAEDGYKGKAEAAEVPDVPEISENRKFETVESFARNLVNGVTAKALDSLESSPDPETGAEKVQGDSLTKARRLNLDPMSTRGEVDGAVSFPLDFAVSSSSPTSGPRPSPDERNSPPCPAWPPIGDSTFVRKVSGLERQLKEALAAFNVGSEDVGQGDVDERFVPEVVLPSSGSPVVEPPEDLVKVTEEDPPEPVPEGPGLLPPGRIQDPALLPEDKFEDPGDLETSTTPVEISEFSEEDLGRVRHFEIAAWEENEEELVRIIEAAESCRDEEETQEDEDPEEDNNEDEEETRSRKEDDEGSLVEVQLSSPTSTASSQHSLKKRPSSTPATPLETSTPVSSPLPPTSTPKDATSTPPFSTLEKKGKRKSLGSRVWKMLRSAFRQRHD